MTGTNRPWHALRWIALGIVLLALFYAAYPYWTLYRLNQALETHDTPRLDAMIDWPSLPRAPQVRLGRRAEQSVSWLWLILVGLGAIAAVVFIWSYVSRTLTWVPAGRTSSTVPTRTPSTRTSDPA